MLYGIVSILHTDRVMIARETNDNGVTRCRYVVWHGEALGTLRHPRYVCMIGTSCVYACFAGLMWMDAFVRFGQYACMRMRLACMYVCMNVCMYICTYVCMYDLYA